MFARRFACVVLLLVGVAGLAGASDPFSYNVELEGYLRVTNPIGDAIPAIAKLDNNVYVVAGASTKGSNFYKIDVSNPEKPREVYNVHLDGHYNKIFILGQSAILSATNISTSTLIADLNASEPAPQKYSVTGKVGALQKNLIASFTNYAPSGPRVYLWDATNNATPQLLSTIIAPESTSFMYFVGGRIVTNWGIIDTSDPSSPVIKKIRTSNQYTDIVGTLGFGFGRPAIHDISDPAAPIAVGTYTNLGNVRAGDVSGTLYFISVESSGLYAIDYTDPGAPDFIRGFYKLPAYDGALVTSGDLIYFYDAVNKILSVLRYTGSRPDYSVPVYDAEVVQVGVPSIPTAISVTMRNNGMSSWSGQLDFKLAVIEDTENIVATPHPRINLPWGAVVYPGEEYTFSIPINQVPGNHTVKFQMIQEFVTTFGQVAEATVNIPGFMLQEK